MKTRNHHILFSEWFPPHDPVATSVARLCILREDYLLELQGIVKRGEDLFDDQGFKELDENSAGWRRMYFHRNSIRTLFEIRNAVEALFSVKERADALLNETPKLQEAFRNLRTQMTIAATLVKRLRHDIGGHVQHSAVQKALDGIPSGSGGFYQQGEMLGKTRYKFTSELMLAIMLPGVLDKDIIQELENMLGETAELIKVLGTIDEVVKCFIESRHLCLP